VNDLEELERILADTRADAGRGPEDFHPFYEPLRTFILGWLERENSNASDSCLWVPIPGAMSTGWGIESLGPTQAVALYRELPTVGHAPFVGDPYLYWWACARDRFGRYVNGVKHQSYLDGTDVNTGHGRF
jgi:hypothetical protein